MKTLALPSAAPTLGQRVARLTEIAEAVPLSLLQLMARVGVGAVFFKSGMVKIASWEQTIQLFADEYRVPVLPPELAAYLATAAELTCPVFLVLGLASRLAALPLLGMTLVIQFFVYPESYAEHLTWATLLLAIVSRGAGKISLDHVVKQLLGGQR